MGADAHEPVFTELTLAGHPALEVTYQEKSELTDGPEQERAFIVETAQGIAAISLDSLDSEEHKSILPAYDLAKSTLTPTG